MTVFLIVGGCLLSLIYLPILIYLCVTAGVAASVRTRQRILSELIRENIRSPLERNDDGE